MAKGWRTYKRLHKWPGFILAFILLYYGISGIFMNHREWISGVDVSRNNLPAGYRYDNWNNAALKGNLILNSDSILVYGNIGIWLTDSSFRNYSSFNHGFPKGTDNRKIADVHRSADGTLYAATLFGLYAYYKGSSGWEIVQLEKKNCRFTAVESIGDTVYALSRSNLYKAYADGRNTRFEKKELKAPQGYVNEVTLFQTIWQLHSGELFGLPGKLLVDLLGILTIFLSLTGIVYFLFPGWIKRRFRRRHRSPRLIRVNKWSLKWHNKLGAWTFILLVILYFTGMFLRPPMLLFIAESTVKPIKFSNLDQPNPWHDKLRDLLYDPSGDAFFLSTSEGIYSLKRENAIPELMRNQPPVSVMGINTFEKLDETYFLVGSFSGFFAWNPSDPDIFNYINGRIYQPQPGGRPIGDVKITGMITGADGRKYFADYDMGVLPLHHDLEFPPMPPNVLAESGMSLWNLSLELHTGRIFEGLLGDFYILVVPLIGLFSVTIVISGYILWRRKYKKPRQH